MTKRIVLLPGWGLGTAPLEPLAQALSALGLEASVVALPEGYLGDVQGYLDLLDKHLPQGVWLAGWSLGGMLATALSARRQERCAGLISLASNLRFVAQPDWPWAMPAETFVAFASSVRVNPEATLKRFTMLCAQGSEQARLLSRELLSAREEASSDELSAALTLLAALDNRQAVVQFAGHQLHLLAQADALVPQTCFAAMQALGDAAKGHVQVELFASSCHGFVTEQATLIAQRIHRFIEVQHAK